MKAYSVKELQKFPIVAVTFLDHVSGSTEPMTCEAYGRLIYKDRVKLILLQWLAHDDDFDTIRHNWEIVTVLKSTVTNIRRIGR